MWTKFFDMCSGGSEKTDWSIIYIELPEDEARVYFEDKFGLDPDNFTCSCCGRDFTVYEVDEEPTEGSGTLIIREADIKI
jgi:transcription initiation factor IIE alpha subunit